MRIAVQSDAIYPTPYACGHGLGRAVFNVARELANRGHEVTLFGLDGSDLPNGRVVTTSTYGFSGEYELAQQVEASDFDVALDAGHMHALANAGTLPTIAWFQDRASVAAANPVYVSADQRAHCGPWGPVVHNGVVLNEYPLSRKRRNGRLLFVGSSVWHKGLEQARKVSALADMPLDEYGEGTLGGPIGGRDKVQAIQAASWLVFPAHIDAGPQTPLEAMACGTPVVGLAKAATIEYVPSGYLGPTAEAMAHIVRNVRRPAPETMYRWVRDAFTVERQTDAMEKLLEAVAYGARW